MVNLSNYASSDSENGGTCARGPVPANSMVGVVVSVKDSQYGDPGEPYIVTAKSGLRRLNICFEVACGTYKGVRWTEGITLPKEEQTIQLTDGQKKSADIGGCQLCRLWDASHGVQLGDMSAEANEKRAACRSWADFANLKCFVKVGIQDGKDGKKYNCLSNVVDIASSNYATLKEKLEIIAEVKPEPVKAPADVFISTSDEDIPF